MPDSSSLFSPIEKMCASQFQPHSTPPQSSVDDNVATLGPFTRFPAHDGGIKGAPRAGKKCCASGSQSIHANSRARQSKVSRRLPHHGSHLCRWRCPFRHGVFLGSLPKPGFQSADGWSKNAMGSRARQPDGMSRGTSQISSRDLATKCHETV